MVREESEARADAVWPGETRRGEQAHHPEGDASAQPCRPIDLNGWTADPADAHDLISLGVVRRAGGAMDKKVKKKVLQQIPYGAYIVGTQTEDGKDWLMFGTWLMQTSFKPTLVAFAFRKDSRTLANVRRSKSFAVSFIREGTQDVAELVLDGAFEKVKTERTASGLPCSPMARAGSNVMWWIRFPRETIRSSSPRSPTSVPERASRSSWNRSAGIKGAEAVD